jgi:hypothetical protein
MKCKENNVLSDRQRRLNFPRKPRIMQSLVVLSKPLRALEGICQQLAACSSSSISLLKTRPRKRGWMPLVFSFIAYRQMYERVVVVRRMRTSVHCFFPLTHVSFQNHLSKPLTSLSCPLMREYLRFRCCKFLTSVFNLNCSAWERAPDVGLKKRATFTTLIIGSAGTGYRTRATCMAGSGANRSAIHYDSSVHCCSWTQYRA